MKKIMLLDTSIGSSNVGDFIIMECVREELEFILNTNFVYNMPTHLPAFSSFSVWRNSLAIQNYTNCDIKFAGGSNLLVKDLKTHYPQWNIHYFNSRPLQGTILVGVGAGTGDYSNKYTLNLYKKILNKSFYHSVRDERSKLYLESLGINAINTGCVTMWKLTPDFCKEIPIKKASRCIFTLTGRSNSRPLVKEDQHLINILKRNYNKVYYWVQGDHDLDYLNRFDNIDNIKIIPPSIDAYDTILKEDDLDYIGTRLHGGIYAMRHKKRSIIISIDERATEIKKHNNIVCIDRKDISDKLEKLINSQFKTEIIMPYDRIKRWKDQFKEYA